LSCITGSINYKNAYEEHSPRAIRKREIAMKKYRVVFHLDEPREGRSDQMFRNIENLLADLGKNNV
jgi:hypothetical protein